MTDILQPTPMRAAETNTPPAFTLPPDACDAHFHVFEPGYPHVPHPHYTFPDGTIDQYLALTGALGIERMVLVQPSFYGANNSLLEYTLKRLGPRCRGVIQIEEDTTDAELDAPPEPPPAAGTCSSTRRARSSATCCRSSLTWRTLSSSTTWAT